MPWATRPWRSAVSQIETVAGRFLQVANMRYSFDASRPVGDRVTGVQIGALIGGLVLTEEIFILPGVGRLLLESIQKRDFPVITGTTLFLATAFVAINLVVDLLHGVLDPRIRR